MAIKLCTPAEIEDHLETLKIFLLDLPDTVTDGNEFYNFTHFVPDPEKVKDFSGEDAAGESFIACLQPHSLHFE